jgi:hypothetical protein
VACVGEVKPIDEFDGYPQKRKVFAGRQQLRIIGLDPFKLRWEA